MSQRLVPTIVIFAASSLGVTANQTLQSLDWTVQVANEYQVIGPFPQEAREQHYLFPGYPLRAPVTLPLNFTSSFPSHLVDEGWVYWSNASLIDRQDEFHAQNSARYAISFPRVRWGAIRATEGWAGLQHHVLLHTKIFLMPPLSYNPLVDQKPTHLLLSASQCSYLAVLAPISNSVVPRWHTGNIYAYSDAPAIKIPLNDALFASRQYTSSSQWQPTDSILKSSRIIQLDLLMSLDYEIRLFGDPLVSQNDATPTIQAELEATIEFADLYDSSRSNVIPSVLAEAEQDPMSLAVTTLEEIAPCIQIGEPDSHIVPHFVDGWAYGDVIGIEVTSCSQYHLTFQKAVAMFADDHPLKNFSANLVEPIRLAPSQTRTISLKIDQYSKMSAFMSTIFIRLLYGRSSEIGPNQLSKQIQTTIKLIHHPSLSIRVGDTRGILMTYYSVSNIPASAVILPPPDKSQLVISSHTRILVALHGAGVMHTSPFVIASLPRPEHTWVLVTQGLTPWGLDWREASRADLCAALRALVLRLTGGWNEDDYCTTHDNIHRVIRQAHLPYFKIPVVAIGHSNGGQGSLHLASQFPDCIPSLIPAAGYISARLYVATGHSRGSLFADAALQGILRASLQGQDGDIIAGNLAFSRVRLVHGGNDENVPVWHSRERMALVKTWDINADISLIEVPGKPHFWPSVFQDEPVANAIAEVLASPYTNLGGRDSSFVFTVVWPYESGSMHGWRVRELTIPGRIARVRVNQHTIRTTNVHGMSVNLKKAGLSGSPSITVDGQHISLSDTPIVWLRRDEKLKWAVLRPFEPYPSGPLSRILTVAETIVIIIPHEKFEYYESIALRLAHNLYTYLKLDCDILRDHEAIYDNQDFKNRSIIVVGGQLNQYGRSVRASPLKISTKGLVSIAGMEYGEAGTAAISLHQNHLYLDAVDESGYERALRIFPLRTGVPGPEWIILGKECDDRGYGGVLAAGFWNRTGGLSEVISYFT
ncbi:hypothetical protein BDV93DRAFT_611299 [Ceratobasidium sp. AG-I]|nr:hypothetical protein BDV93DRAFT_611299 [Ceratobasidium sp. AG-I]